MKNFILRLYTNLLTHAISKQPAGIKKDIAELFAEPLQKVVQILSCNEQDQTRLLEELVKTDTPNFLVKAQKIAQDYKQVQNTHSSLSNLSSNTKNKQPKIYDNDQSE